MVIPRGMRSQIRNDIHSGHQGLIKKCLRQARVHVFWPGMKKGSKNGYKAVKHAGNSSRHAASNHSRATSFQRQRRRRLKLICFLTMEMNTLLLRATDPISGIFNIMSGRKEKSCFFFSHHNQLAVCVTKITFPFRSFIVRKQCSLVTFTFDTFEASCIKL